MIYTFDAWFFESEKADSSSSRHGRYALGIFFIFFLAVIWVASNVCSQYFYTETEFNSPFLITYIGLCLFAFILPCKLYTDSLGITIDTTNCNPCCHDNADDDENPYYQDPSEVASVSSFEDLLRHKGPYWNHGKHFFVALHIAPVIFVATWLLNASLDATSVASATVLVSTSCLFAFLLAVLVLKEESWSWLKLLGVILGICGIFLSGFHDLTQHDHTHHNLNQHYYELEDECAGSCEDIFWGDCLALISAFSYGAYACQVKLLCPHDEKLYSMALLLGYVGLVILVPLFPMAVFVWDKVEITPTDFGIVVLRGFLDYVVAEYLHFRAVVLTNATIASAGLGMTIPMAFAADWIMEKEHIMSVSSLTGAIAVAMGFLIVTLADNCNKHQQEVVEKEPPSFELNDSILEYRTRVLT